MKIVVADPVILPEKYKRKLESLGELEVFNSMPASVNDYNERIKDAEILLVGKAPISREVLQHASHLKLQSAIAPCQDSFSFVQPIAF